MDWAKGIGMQMASGSRASWTVAEIAQPYMIQNLQAGQRSGHGGNMPGPLCKMTNVGAEQTHNHEP